MRKFDFFKGLFKKQIVGLDIGSSSVKAVQIGYEGDKVLLEKIGFSGIDFIGKDRDISLQHAIHDIWYGQKIKTNKVGISFSGKKVIARYIELPYMEKKDLKQALPFEIQASIPYPLDEVVLTFQVVGEDERNKKIRILYAVSLLSEIDKIRNLLAQLKLEVVFIDLDMTSLERAYRFNYSDLQEDILMVNIGANTTNFNFLHNGASLFARDIEWGGNVLTHALQKSLSLTFEEAEDIKKKSNLIDIDGSEKFNPNSYIDEPLKHLVKEVNLTIRHCMFNYQVSMPNCIYISGGGALLKNLDKYLEQSLDVPVKIFNPFKKIGQINTEIPATVFTTSLSLALRS